MLGLVPTLLGQTPGMPEEYTVQMPDGSRASVPATKVMEVVGPAEVNRFLQTGGSNVINLFANSIPSPVDFDKLLVPYQNTTDIITHEFFDSAALTSAAANTPRLFLTPQTSLFNGNLTGNGVLSNNERFFMVGIRFELENDDTTNPLDIVDVVQTFRRGTQTFNLGSAKYYNQSKLMKFIDPLCFFVLNTNYYSVKPFVTWKLPIPIAIGKQFQFFNDVSLTAATLGSTTRIFCYLCGFHYRNVQ